MFFFPLVGWIVQSIAGPLRSSITYFPTVKELWDDLKQCFSVGNGPRTLQLRYEIATWRQDGKTISEYFNHLKQLRDELSTYVPLKQCTCTGCRCNITAALIQERDDEKTHQFLIGLDDTIFSSLRSNIMAQETLPSLSRVYSLAVQEERLKTMVNSRSVPPENHAFAARRYSSGPKTFAPNKSILPCSHCHKPGHDISTCFKIHGLPDWVKDRNAARRAGNAKTGSAQAAQTALPGTAMAASVLTDNDRLSVSPALNSDQWAAVMALYNSIQPTATSSGKSVSWILDTGASFHMIGDQTLLADITPIPPVPIILPNGTVASARFSDSLRVASVTLKNILFIPELTCNLLSLYELARDLRLLILMIDRVVILQQLHSKTVIGVGKPHGGVYWL